MTETTGLDAQVNRSRRFSQYAVRALVLGLGLLTLGGCKNQEHEDQVSSLNMEIAQLKEEKAQLESTNTTIQAQLAAKQAAPQQPQQPQDYPNGTPDPRSGPQRDIVIEVAGDVLFAAGQVTLKPEAKKELDKVANTIKSKYSGNTIRVEGYTDTDPPNKIKKRFPTNEALSQARAEAVEQYLIQKGISSNRISAVGMGSAKSKATKAASRRVEIVIMGR